MAHQAGTSNVNAYAPRDWRARLLPADRELDRERVTVGSLAVADVQVYCGVKSVPVTHSEPVMGVAR